MKKSLILKLGIETVCLVAILTVLVVWNQSQSASAIPISSEELIRQQTVQQLSGQTGKIEGVIKQQTEAILGEVSSDVFSGQATADAVISGRKKLYGIMTGEELQGDWSAAVADSNALRTALIDKVRQAQAANDAALRSYLINTKTQEIDNTFISLGEKLDKFNNLMLDGIKIADSIQSKVKALAPK